MTSVVRFDHGRGLDHLHPNRSWWEALHPGTRISVEIVLELLANGASPEDIRRAYPHVPGEGISAAIEYAARSLKNEVIWDVKLTA